MIAVGLDDRTVVLVDAMPALHGNVAARFYNRPPWPGRAHGWRGYRLRPDTPPAPQHVTYREHHCEESTDGR